MKNTGLSSILGLVLISVLSACNQGAKSTTVYDLITDSKCTRSCWQGIEPEITTEAEAIEILNSLEGEYQEVFKSLDTLAAIYEWQPTGEAVSHTPTQSVEVAITDGVVAQVTIKAQVCASTIVTEFGEPATIRQIGIQIYLLYPEQQLLFVLDAENVGTIDSIHIAPDSMVQSQLFGTYGNLEWATERDRLLEAECTDEFAR